MTDRDARCPVPVVAVVEADEDLREVLAHVPAPAPTIVVVGAAGGLDATDGATVRPVFRALAALAVEAGAVVVDGGTDAGVMRLMGQERAAAGGNFVLVGVVAIGTVSVAGTPADAGSAPLEPNHSLLLLVPGDSWGHEAPWLSRVASAISRGAPSVTVVMGGGEVAWQDVGESVAAGRVVVALQGVGGAADDLVAALDGRRADGRAAGVVATGLVRGLPAGASPHVVAGTVRALLGGG